MAESSVDLSAPLFHIRFGTPIWRLLPTPDGLVVELRDQVARIVTFVVLDSITGRERARYHDPLTPWWLTAVGLRGATLYLDQLNPDQLGQVTRRRAVDLVTGAVRPAGGGEEGSDAAPALRVPTVYTPASSHWPALARFVENRAGQAPQTRLEYLENDNALVLAWDRPDGANELMVCDATTGAVRRRATLQMARPGPEAGLFCIFGPILLALVASDGLAAWPVSAA